MKHGVARESLHKTDLVRVSVLYFHSLGRQLALQLDCLLANLVSLEVSRVALTIVLKGEFG